MEMEIEELLQEKYKNLIIEVEYKDLRKYEITIIIEMSIKAYTESFIYTWDAHYTKDDNIKQICLQINMLILNLFKRG